MGLRLIYVDERGQGCSPRVDPATLSVRGFAQDIDRLAQAMELDDVRRPRPLLRRDHRALARARARHASHYVISAGVASSEALMADVEREIDRFEPAAMRDQIRRSWDEEARLATVEQARQNTAAQMPFHFWEMGDAYSRFMQADETVYAPEVLAHFAAQGYGDFEWLDHLRWIRRPMLVVVGRYDRTCTLGAVGGDPPRGRGLGADRDREGGPHDARRAAEGLHRRGAVVVHPPGRAARSHRTTQLTSVDVNWPRRPSR